jgi:acetyl esterase
MYNHILEYPFPIPTTDCYSVTKYIFENANEFNGDSNRIIMGGDSAGGNIVAVLTQKFLKEKRKLPKIQILMY